MFLEKNTIYLIVFNGTGVVACNGLLYAVGGCNQDSVEVYNPKTNTWYILSTPMKLKRTNVEAVVIKLPDLYLKWITGKFDSILKKLGL